VREGQHDLAGEGEADVQDAEGADLAKGPTSSDGLVTPQPRQADNTSMYEVVDFNTVNSKAITKIIVLGVVGRPSKFILWRNALQTNDSPQPRSSTTKMQRWILKSWSHNRTESMIHVIASPA